MEKWTIQKGGIMYKKQILLVLMACIWLCCSGLAFAQEPPVPEGQVILAWDANTEVDLEGYQLHYGVVSGTYDTVVNVGNLTTWTVKGLVVGTRYYFVLTAYDTFQNESGYSLEVAGDGKDGIAPALPSGLREVIPEITIIANTVNVIQAPE